MSISYLTSIELLTMGVVGRVFGCEKERLCTGTSMAIQPHDWRERPVEARHSPVVRSRAFSILILEQ